MWDSEGSKNKHYYKGSKWHNPYCSWDQEGTRSSKCN